MLAARFTVPDRLPTLSADLPPSQIVLPTPSDGVLARLVAAALVARAGREVPAIAGGTNVCAAAGLSTVSGEDDQLRSPYLLADIAARNTGFRDYLNRELGLSAQLTREGEVDILLSQNAAATR